MRLGTFLLGGVVGAAAVIYMSKRMNPMFAAASSSDTAMGSLNESGKSKSFAKDSKLSSIIQNAANSEQTPASGKKSNLDESLFKADGLNKVGDIVNQDPKLKAAVDEILAGNSPQGEQQAH